MDEAGNNKRVVIVRGTIGWLADDRGVAFKSSPCLELAVL